jgi:hypothetical protein
MVAVLSLLKFDTAALPPTLCWGGGGGGGGWTAAAVRGEEKKDGGILGGRLKTMMTTRTTMTAGRPLELVVAVRWPTSVGTMAQSARLGACWRRITSDLSRQQYASPGNGWRGLRGSALMRGCGAIGTRGGIAWDFCRRCIVIVVNPRTAWASM